MGMAPFTRGLSLYVLLWAAIVAGSYIAATQASVIGDVGSPALALQPISEQLRNGRPIRIEIRQATFGQAPTSLAILTFTHLLPEGEQETLAFDPTRNSAPGVTLSPGWLTALRRGAYRGSRQGRRDD